MGRQQNMTDLFFMKNEHSNPVIPMPTKKPTNPTIPRLKLVDSMLINKEQHAIKKNAVIVRFFLILLMKRKAGDIISK
jgi:hypothetical protein